MTTFPYSRKSHFLENPFAIRTKDGAYTNFNVTVQLDQTITPSILSISLRQLILQNPALSLNFTPDPEKENSFVAKPVDQILFDDVVEFSTISNPFSEGELKKLNSIVCQIGTNKPLWKIRVFQYEKIQYITVVCEHTLFDGNSGVFFHKDLVEILDKNLQHDSCLEVLFDKKIDNHIFTENFPLPAGELTDLYKTPFLTLVKIIWTKLLCPRWLLTYWRSYMDPTLPNLIENPVFQYKPIEKIIDCNHKLINLTSAQVTTMLTNIKRNKVPFTPVVSAISCQTFEDVIVPIVTPYATCSTSVQVLVNGRRFYPGLQRQLKYTICVCSIEIILGPFSSTNLDKAVEYVNQQVQKDIVSKYSFHLMGALKYTDPSKFVDSRVGTYARPTIEISNLGNQIIEAENVQVENIWFSQDLGTSAQIGYSIVSTKGGMNIVLGVVPEIYHLTNEKNQRIIDVYAEELKHRLLTYGSQ